ncbi:unnamed protein product [Adineta ricciae]|uniref:EF-hand domain-containing protein n=1 Tax=Adineta ricciae TaxID=249248 RepID=A0A816B465_ADIRI|nr:unnamed protein product [Adineta ricciae]CAF1602898.1 unnamed protein product [Adineta ricciae]
MGNHSNRPTAHTWNPNRLEQTTGLSQDQIDQFHAKYIEASEHDGVMNMNKFTQLYSHLPWGNPGHLQDRAMHLFRAFDRDHNDILSFDEFLAIIIFIDYELNRNQSEISSNSDDVQC